jgi:alkylation response protein AidB-like acyl-CoA dehydrogenase
MWNILPNEDEAMIADSVREFLTAELPLQRLRPKPVKVVEWDAIRPEMAQLGWFAVGLPEACGGSGLGLVEEMLIQREFGRAVASLASLGMVVAGQVCAAAGDTVLAAEVTSGEVSVGVALVRDGGAAMVFDWRPGDRIVAWTDDGVGLFPSEALAGALQGECTDDSLSLHSGTLALDKAIHWIPAAGSDLLLRVRVLLAAALAGLAERACELTVDYARIREQFGVAIGSFQAVKHRCADMGVRARLAWYQTCVAALQVADGADGAPLQVESALLLAAEAGHENGRAGIQLHGGIGFQAECDIHWFMKRTHVYEQLAGGKRAVAARVLAA